MKPTITPPQVIKAIYLLRHECGIKATALAVGKSIGVSGPVINRMVATLARKGVIKSEPYKGFFLTPKGQLLAMRQIRCHRLWETFLHRNLNMGLWAIHREALRLESHTSDAMLAAMDEQLGHPLFDPHGDPIPSSEGVMPDVSEIVPLPSIADGTTGIIARLSYQTEALSLFCDRHGVNIGDEITVISKEPTGGINLKHGHDLIYATRDSASQIFLYKQA